MRIYLLAPWVALGPAMLATVPCQAQGNINAGRSPAQIFADTCAVCHRDVHQLRRSSVAFLQKHYTTGYRQAAMMAGYLSRLPVESPPAQPKPAPTTDATTATNASEQQGRQQPATADQPNSVQAEPNGRLPGATPKSAPASRPLIPFQE